MRVVPSALRAPALTGVSTIVFPVLVFAQGRAPDSAAAAPRGGPVWAADSVSAADSVADAFRGRIGRAARGAAVATIDSLPGDGARTTLADMLTARLPGVSVLRTSGSAGTGSRIRLRGIESVRGRGAPLLVVDGIRMDADPTTALIEVGGQDISALDDLSPDDVERVEVLRGPAAAAMYGTGAAAGVIVVTTRRAAPRRFSWDAFGRVGRATDVADFPGRYWASGTAPDGSPVVQCTLYMTVDTGCAQNPLLYEAGLAGQSVFGSATTTAVGGSLGGSIAMVDLRASASADRDAATVAENEAQRFRLRGDVRARLHRGLDLRVSGGHLTADRSLPLNDNLTLGLLRTVLTRWPAGAPPAGAPLPPELSVAGGPNQESARTTGGADVEWRALPWLRLRATAGQDRARRDAVQLPPVLESSGTNWTIGPYRVVAEGERVLTTLRGVLSADWRRGDRLALAADVGVERIRLKDDREERVDVNGGPGPSAEWHGEIEATEPMARLRGVWSDRLFASVGVRRGDLAPDRRWYPAAEVSWLVGGRRALGWLSEVRLRAAYGEVAGADDPDSAFTLVFAGPGIQRERVRELEAGVDARIARRVDVAITAYRQETRGLHLLRPTGAPGGPQLANVGDLRNQGLEAALRARVVDRGAFSLDVGTSAAFADAKITRLEVPGYVSSTGPVREGESPWALWEQPYTFADANSDGIIALAEITPAAARVAVGPSVPTREIGLEGVARVGILTLAALVDHRGGHRQVNGTRYLQCVRAACEELYRVGSPLADQARYRMSGNGSLYGYTEKGDFTRLRELSLSVDLPAVWSGRVGREARLTLAGYNLVTWTEYSGLDPETTFDASDPVGQHELWTQPLPRSFSVRLDLGR